VLGPGLTVTPSTSAFVQAVLRDVAVPVLLDADALNILSLLLRQGIVPQVSRASTVLTPHAGELKRLYEAVGVTDAQQLAEKLDVIVVAKGPETRIVSPSREHRSTAGTPALAKAGTGDVLSGIIGSFMAQGIAPFDAALLGVELHGRAGQLAEAHLGQRAVCAEDLIDSLPAALKSLEKCVAASPPVTSLSRAEARSLNMRSRVDARFPSGPHEALASWVGVRWILAACAARTCKNDRG
jgi:NAD(P)H-hydrate epimerase